MKIAKGSTLLMVGDSITDVGRLRPVGEREGLGIGYVYFIGSLMGATYPDRLIRVLNVGNGGDTVRDLSNRWQSDVIQHKPQWVSVMIGTNDVWRQFDSIATPEAAVQPDEFEATYTRLVRETRPNLAGMVLMSPFYVEPNQTEPMRARMDEYRNIVRRIADGHDCIFVDTQKYFDDACRYVYPGTLAGDRVHPSMYGAAILARAFLNAVDFEF
jgi:lysophospholipase L1-like esterase